MSAVQSGWWRPPFAAASVSLLLLVTPACTGDDGEDATNNASSEEPAPSTTTSKVEADPSSRYCELAAVLLAPGLDESPDQLREFYDGFDERASELEREAPKEIAGELRIFIDGVVRLQSRLESVDYEAESLDPEKIPELSDPAFPQAGQRVRAFNEKLCTDEAVAGEPAS